MARLTFRQPPAQPMQTGGTPVDLSGIPTEDDIAKTIQPIGQLTNAEQELTLSILEIGD